jgi:hypothetical protein
LFGHPALVTNHKPLITICISNDSPPPHQPAPPGKWLPHSQKFRDAILPSHQALPTPTTWQTPPHRDTPWLTQNPTPLLHNWQDIAYTDASLTTIKHKEVTTLKREAGIHHPETNQQTCIDPLIRNTPLSANSAELVGIWGATHQGHTTIATDSLTSIHQLRNMLLNPMDMRYHPLKPLLLKILNNIRSSIGDKEKKKKEKKRLRRLSLRGLRKCGCLRKRA